MARGFGRFFLVAGPLALEARAPCGLWDQTVRANPGGLVSYFPAMRLALLLFLAVSSAAGAQTPEASGKTGTLTGRVFSGENGEPLVGATVFLPEVQRGASTNLEGAYTLLEVPEGDYEVHVIARYLVTREIPGVEIRNGWTRRLEVALEQPRWGIVHVRYERPTVDETLSGHRTVTVHVTCERHFGCPVMRFSPL